MLSICACVIGLHLASAHRGGGYEAGTIGLYARAPTGLTFGLLRNSERRLSGYAGWTMETHGRDMAVTLGVITGYSSAPISPMLVPSVRIALGQGWAVRLAYVPKPRTPRGSDALHLTIEW